MIEWNEGYTVSYRLMRVNELTWMDSEAVPGVTSASITRDATDDVPLLESSSISMVLPQGERFQEGWYRLEALAIDSLGAFERRSLCTMLYEAGGSTAVPGREEFDLTGKSVLQPASDRKFLAGAYVPKGVDGAQYAADLLKESFPGPVEVDGSFTMDDYLVFSAGTSHLQVVWRVLQSAGWCIQIDGDGRIFIREKAKDPKLVMSDATANLMQPSLDKSFDLEGIPNRYFASYYDEESTATNEDPDSATSYQARGRWIDMVDTSPSRVNGETMYAYARRRLEEESTIVQSYSYTRRFDPDILPFDLVRASVSDLGFEGDLRVLTQKISCGRQIEVSEKAGREVALWRANV